MKEKERERRALSSWPVSFESFDVKHGVLVEQGFGCPSCNEIKDNKRAQAHSDRFQRAE